MKLYQSISDKIDFESVIAHELDENSYINTTILLPGNYLEHSLADKKTLKNCLIQYFFSLSILQDALIQFLDHHYRKFDALIGNNSCYVSAYVIFKIANRIENDREFKAHLITTLKKLDKTKKKISTEINEMDIANFPAQDFRQFLLDQGLILDLSTDLIYLGLAFACAVSKGKNAQNVEEIQYETILLHYKKLDVNLAKKSTVKLIKHWQKVLSILNVKTLQSHVKFSNAQPWAKYLFGKYVLKDERNRHCLPSFYASKVIYDLLLSIPGALVGLQVNIIQCPGQYLNRFTLLFEVQPDRALRVLDSEEPSSTQPVYMFVGCRYISQPAVDIPTLKAEFMQRSLEEIIFAHEVTYPQYPKALKAKNVFPCEPDLLQEINRLKKLEGFSFENPSDLCLVHIFVDDTQSQALSVYDPPVYLPTLSQQEGDDKSCNKTYKC